VRRPYQFAVSRRRFNTSAIEVDLHLAESSAPMIWGRPCRSRAPDRAACDANTRPTDDETAPCDRAEVQLLRSCLGVGNELLTLLTGSVGCTSRTWLTRLTSVMGREVVHVSYASSRSSSIDRVRRKP